MHERTIIEEKEKNIVIMDVFSKLIQERIIFIDDVITDELANGVIAQMLYLDSISNEKIQIYINTPGGDVYSGLAIYDVSKLIKSPIRTVCVGLAASMGSILMLMGKERCGLKHSRVMLHQISGGASGQLSNMVISVDEMKKLNKEIQDILIENTLIKDIEKTILFDNWYTSKEALECGILTEIL